MAALTLDALADFRAPAAADEFLALVSHELCTPLTAIKGFVDLLMSGDDSNLTPEQREYLAIVAASTERQLLLIGQLLEYGRLRTGGVTLNLGPIDLPGLLEEAALQFRQGRPDRSGVVVTCDVRAAEVVADWDRLRQLFAHLFSDADRRWRKGEQLRLEARRRAGTVTVDLNILGPAEELDRPQDFTAGPARSDEPSVDSNAGFALAIAGAIAQSHGGVLHVQYHADKVTYRLTLPATGQPSTAS